MAVRFGPGASSANDSLEVPSWEVAAFATLATDSGQMMGHAEVIPVNPTATVNRSVFCLLLS
jgi:hypothetical protein